MPAPAAGHDPGRGRACADPAPTSPILAPGTRLGVGSVKVTVSSDPIRVTLPLAPNSATRAAGLSTGRGVQ